MWRAHWCPDGFICTRQSIKWPTAMLLAASRSNVFPTIGGQVALLTLLMGCPSTGAESLIFDYVASTAQSAETEYSNTNGKKESVKTKSASALLGIYQTGPGYTVQANVISDGRYNTYIFETEYGTYSMVGDELTRQHIQELIALDALKKRSKTQEFVDGVGSAVVAPVKGVIATVMDPVGAAKATYANIERKVASIEGGVTKAGEYITTFGKPEKKRPDRERDGLLESLVDRPKVKRRLARELNVDPYTHFVPLVNELDKVASYSTAGEFGINGAVGFVPGAAGIAISSIRTIDSLTKQTLDMGPEQTASVNRDRLEKLNIPKDTIKKLLLSDILTPTEKTQAVGFLDGLSGTPGRDVLALFIATSDTRHGAVVALLTLSHLSARPFGDNRISNIELIDGIPVFTIGENNRIVIFTSDDLAWTPANADQLSKLGAILKSSSKRGAKKEIWISGNATPLTERELQRQGWIVKTRTFTISNEATKKVGEGQATSPGIHP